METVRYTCHNAVITEAAYPGPVTVPLTGRRGTTSAGGSQASAGAELCPDGLGVLAERRDPAHDRVSPGDLGRRQQRADLPAGRADGPPAVPGKQLRVAGQLRGGAQPGVRDPSRLKRLAHLSGGPAG